MAHESNINQLAISNLPSVQRFNRLYCDRNTHSLNFLKKIIENVLELLNYPIELGDF